MYFFNKNKMDSLPAWAKSILLNAAKLTGFNMTVQSQHDSAVNWATMKQEFPNIVVKNFPSDVIDALRASNQTLLEEERSKSEVAAEIIDSQAAYLSTVRRWTEIGDWSYLANITQ
jgi:TRAP-type mannitol/chloroaromatic compound transport system substrate-binding protein